MKNPDVKVKRSSLWRRVLCALLSGALVWLSVPVALAGNEAAPVAEDPELEARVLELSHELRCLVCQNESLAESRAPLALDLREQVREQFRAGKSQPEVIDFLVTRYGDFVLYRPPFKAITVVLWLGPALFLMAGLGWLAWRLRRRAAEAAPPLSNEEQARARALLAGKLAGENPTHSPEELRL